MEPASLTPQPAPTQATARSPAISSDFETFLKMLTTQIQNQDPMDPMKSEEFAVQLATFSSVEQQVRTNELLEAMATGRTGGDRLGAQGLIGQQVSALMPLAFAGDPVRLDPPRPAAGDRHVLILRDESEVEVARLRLDALGTPVTWDGNTPLGPAPTGRYHPIMQSYEGDTLVAEQPVAAFDRVVEIRFGTNGPIILTEGGAELAQDEITSIRASAE